MYNNYIFDLYGTLIDINTDEWNDDLWKKIAILYAYKGAHYTYDELNEEYDRLVQAEKKAVLKKSPDTKVVDIKIEKVFRKLFAQKGVKVTKAEVLFIAEAFRCYSTKYIKLYRPARHSQGKRQKGLSSLKRTAFIHGKRAEYV